MRALHGGKAGVEAALAGEQIARQAIGHGGIDQPREAALGDGAEIGHGDGEDVHGLRHVLPMEVTAGNRHVAALAIVEDQRVVGGGIDLRADDALDIFHRLDGRAVNLRRAAQGIHVLHARARGRAGLARLIGEDDVAGALRAALRAFEDAQQVARDPGLPGMRARLVHARIEGRQFAAHRLQRQAHGDVGMLQDTARIAGGERASASDVVEPLMSAEASLAPRSKSGSKPALRSPRGPACGGPDRSSRLPRSRKPHRPYGRAAQDRRRLRPSPSAGSPDAGPH